jgi:hypothetical protein
MDPDYVEKCPNQSYDEHLDFAVIKGEITRDQYDFLHN